MITTRILRSGLLAALLTAWTFGDLSAQAPKDVPIPGAKFLHKFPHEFYRLPLLFSSGEANRLLVWVDKNDPKLFADFDFKNPVKIDVELIAWDLAKGEEVFKVGFPKDLAPVIPTTFTEGHLSLAPNSSDWFALSPDGKKLAQPVVTAYQPFPGSIGKQAVTEVKAFDLYARKSAPAGGKKYTGMQNPNIFFTPDGNLVVLAHKECSTFEPGKTKPRKTFAISRSAAYSMTINAKVNDTVLSADGSKLAVAADGMLHVYDFVTGKVLYQGVRVVPEIKPGPGIAPHVKMAALAFAPTSDKLLVVESVYAPPKSFVQSRYIDLKEKTELNKTRLVDAAPQAGVFKSLPTTAVGQAFFTPQGEPRVLCDGKLFDGGTGKLLHQFAADTTLIASREGKYLVRISRSTTDKARFAADVWSLEAVK
jgi:hypothetical protein